MEKKPGSDQEDKSGNWIKCQSKRKNGRFYLFNSATGESRWDNTEASLNIPNSIKTKTPAQDRLKRLQNNLKRGSPPKSVKNKTSNKVLQKIKIGAPSSLSVTSKNVHAKSQKPSTVTSAVTQKAVLEKFLESRLKIVNKRKDEEVASTSKSLTILDSIASGKKFQENICLEGAKKQNRKVPISSTESEKSLQKQSSVTGQKTGNDNKFDPCNVVKMRTILFEEKKGPQSETQVTNQASKGFLNKIKDTCKGLINKRGRRKSSNDKSEEPVKKQSFKPHKTVTEPIKATAVLSGLKEETLPLTLTAPPSATVQKNDTNKFFPIPASPPRLILPAHPIGSANARLEIFRKTLRGNAQNLKAIPEKNKVASESIEPMDWQPSLDFDNNNSEEVIVPSCNTEKCFQEKTNTNSCTKKTHIDDNNSATMSEYYDIVNKNLLRFAAENEKISVHHRLNKWNSDFYYFIVDTNVLIDYLTFLDDLVSMKLCGTQGTKIYIPYCVLQELDKLKIRSHSESTKTRSVRAIKYLNKKFEEKFSNIQAQSASDERIHLIKVTSPDDSILNCCLQVKQKVANVMLLSEDVNLRNKALCNGVLVSTKSDLISSHVEPG